MNSKSKIIPLFVILILMSLLLPGCDLLNGNAGSGTGEAASIKTGTLQCSEECAARGQCGSSDQGNVVLAHRIQPAVENHDFYFVEGTAVQIINEQEQRTLQLISGGEPFPHNFNQIRSIDAAGNVGETAWLTSWCVQQD